LTDDSLSLSQTDRQAGRQGTHNPPSNKCVCSGALTLLHRPSHTHTLCAVPSKYQMSVSLSFSKRPTRKSISTPARKAAACSGASGKAPSKSMNLFYLHSAGLQVCSLSYFPTCFTISGTESHGHKTELICGYSHTNFSRQIRSIRSNSVAVDYFCDMTPNSIPRNILRLQGSLHPRRPTDSYPTES
jgi:hypothetical protein